MVYTQRKTIQTEQNSITSITEEVDAVLVASGIRNGILVVETPHSTAGILRTTDKAKSAHKDLMYDIKRLVPSRVDFVHKESPDDAAGHIKCALFGTSVSAIIQDGKPVSDKKLGYFFVEYDGPRARTYYISIVGE